MRYKEDNVLVKTQFRNRDKVRKAVIREAVLLLVALLPFNPYSIIDVAVFFEGSDKLDIKYAERRSNLLASKVASSNIKN